MAELCRINLILQHRYYVQPYYHNSHIVTIKLYLLKLFYSCWLYQWCYLCKMHSTCFHCW